MVETFRRKSRGFSLRFSPEDGDGRNVVGIFLCVTLVLASRIGVVSGNQYGNDVEKIYVRAGLNATLPCPQRREVQQVRSLEWWKEDRKIAEWQMPRMVAWEADTHVRMLPDSHSLFFSPVSQWDNGEYQCIVNGQRRRKVYTRLYIQDVPEPPGMPLIMSFTSRAVNLSWASSVDNHNSAITHYIIHIRVGELGEWDLTNKIVTSGNITNYQVTSLQPYTVYSFRVVAVNSIGPSHPSKESYFMVTLRELPSGKPTITSAHNTSSTSIRLQWEPPPKHTIHGEFLGYRITYKPRQRPGEEREVIVRDFNARAYTIRNLDVFTQYLVSVQVINPKGAGPVATAAVMTDEGVPSPPQNLSILRVTEDTVQLRWQVPEFPSGVIVGYKIYYLELDRNRTDSRKVYHAHSVMEYTLHDLNPYTKYRVWIKAFTNKYEGEASRSVEFQTDVKGPSAPNILNITCQSLDSLLLHWQRPLKIYNQIDYYYVYYRSEDNWDFTEISLPIRFNSADHMTLIPNLTANTMYEVKVQGGTRSVVEHAKIYRGPFSDPRKVLLQSYSALPYHDSSVSAGMVAGIICASFALILAVISFALWRKYFQAAYYYLDNPPGNRASPQLSEIFDAECASIPVMLFPKHVQDLHADGDIGFSREYESIQQCTDLDLSCEYSQMMENKNKNRYVNIVAYDHTRVVLKPIPGHKPSADYINANYIDGYNKPQAYIGTQGPLPSTFDDYWRMIWEQRVFIIVMITNLVERGRHEPSTSDLDDSRKCDMYWPKEGTETYGIIQVKLVQEVVMSTYTIRTFHIKNIKVRKQSAERTIFQYHYTNWPDHGVPEHPLPVLSFIRKSSSANPPNAGPIIVHCSAGVGRTGTYIVLDAMLRQINHRQSLNVYGFLKHIRQQRNYLVQTEEQYIFIHDALVEAIESGETEVPVGQLSRYIQNLQTADVSCNNDEKSTSWPLLDKQYKLVSSFKAKDFNVVSALKPCNKVKNRSLNLIPIESNRVHITPKPGTDGSDYINATFMPGYSKLKEFIITQHPLNDTIADFWQMVWDHNSQIITVLSVVDEKEYPRFWPEKGDDKDYGNFKVKLVEEKQETDSVTLLDFILQSTQDDYELLCRLVLCPRWPEFCCPLSTVFDLIHSVHEFHSEYQNGPVLVVDKFGGCEASTFCIVMTLFKQMETEGSIDLYMFTKMYHMRRPGIWRTQDDFLFLYRALESIVLESMPLDSDSVNQANNTGNGHVNTNGHAVKLDITGKFESLA